VQQAEREEGMEYSIQLNAAAENAGSHVKAFASIVFGDSFKVTKIAILENKEGKNFVAMPGFQTRERDENNQPVFKDICNPVTKEFRQQLYGDILQLYDEMEQAGKEKTYKKAESKEMPEFTVHVTPFEREGSHLSGLASMVLEDSFAVSNISIYKGKSGEFVSMPSNRTGITDKDGKMLYSDICYPVTKEFREKMNTAVMETYQKEKQKATKQGQRKPEMQNNRRYGTEDTPFR